MDQNGYDYYIGIDISKANLDVALSDNANIKQFPNNEAGLNKLLKALPVKGNGLIIMEASGGYEAFSAKWLRKKGYAVAVVNAKRVRDFAKAAGVLAKTDAIDCKMIRKYGETFKPQPQPPESLAQEELSACRKRREQLIKMITMEKQHSEQASDNVKKSIKKHIKVLENELEELEGNLEELISQDPELQEKVSRLDEIKGVGQITAMNVIIAIPELGTLNSKEVSALAGVAPFNNDSGKRQGKRKTRGGRSSPRAALYMAVLSAKAYNPAIKEFYDRLIAKGKAKKVAIVACMRKLIIIMNAMIRDGSSWKSEILAN